MKRSKFFIPSSLNELFTERTINDIINKKIKDILNKNVIITYYQQITHTLISSSFEKQLIIHISNQLDALYVSMRNLLFVPFDKISDDIAWFSFDYTQLKHKNAQYNDPSQLKHKIDTIIGVIDFWIVHFRRISQDQIPVQIVQYTKSNTEIKPKKQKRQTQKKICKKDVDPTLIHEWQQYQLSNKQFEATVRNPLNCISNYIINKDDIDDEWLKSKESIQISNRNNAFKSSHYLFKQIHKYYPNNDLIDQEILMDHNIHSMCYVSSVMVKCPNCLCSLQCIPITPMLTTICFICFNYPKCKFPLNNINYQLKYIWNKVQYIGPIMCSSQESEQDEYTKLASFGFNEKQYQTFKNHENTKCKKLRMIKRHKQHVATFINTFVID